MNNRYKNLYKAYRLSKYYIPGDENFSAEEDEYNFQNRVRDYIKHVHYIRNHNLRVYSKRRKLIKKYEFYHDLIFNAE